MRGVYFNENDPYPAQWLRNLWPESTVDERSIHDVSAATISGFRRVHLFAGIGGWEEALRLAGWPEGRPVGTGSAPCQPFSCAGKRKGTADDRHLWPEMRRIIGESEIDCWFGEQVSSPDGRGWLAGIQTDLEGMGFVFGAADICAAGVSAPHLRQRLFWVAHRPGERSDGPTGRAESRRGTISEGGGVRLGDSSSTRLQNGSHGGMPSKEQPGQWAGPVITSHWDNFDIVEFADHKTRRIESGLEPLVAGLHFQLADGSSRKAAKADGVRAAILKGIGNSIVPQVAAAFIRAFLETEAET